MSTFDLDRLPYDLLPSLLANLDRVDILNACLVSKAFNELASRTLYSSIIIHRKHSRPFFYSYDDIPDNIKSPFSAFERRPELRTAVTEAHLERTLAWQGEDKWRKGGGPKLWDRVASEFALMPRLRKVSLSEWRGRWNSEGEHRVEEEFFFDIVSIMPNITSVGTWKLPYESIGKLGHVKDIFPVDGFDVYNVLDVKEINTRVTELKIGVWDIQPLITDKLRLFISLRQLRVEFSDQLDSMELCNALKCMPDLRDLTLVVALREDMQFLPSGLKKLESLKLILRFVQDSSPAESRKLIEVLSSIAGSSHLQSMVLRNRRERKIEYNGKGWLAKFLRRHGPTLRILRISQVSPSSEVSRSVFRCPQLEDLWLGMNSRLMIELPSLIVTARYLNTLRLSPPRDITPWSIGQTAVLLLQNSKSLREVKVYISGREQQRMWKATWKTEWKYDPGTQKPLMSIHGPLQAKIPTLHRPRDITKWDEDTTDEHQDYTFGYDQFSDTDD